MLAVEDGIRKRKIEKGILCFDLTGSFYLKRIQKHELLILFYSSCLSVSISSDTFFLIIFQLQSSGQLFGGHIGYVGLQMKTLTR